MSESYDVVAIGSGHNGLVAAAYMAAAGKKVLVLERNAWLGGGVVTRELTVPGFRHDQHSMAHIFIQANPLLKNDELGLKARHGLRYVVPELPMMSVFEDGSTLGLYRDRERSCAEIARFSQRDADAYRWLADKAAGYMPMVESSLYTAPTPLGATYALMDQSREGRELWRYMQMSSHDLLGEIFEHDRVRMHFARVAGENLVSPDEKSTGMGVFVFVGFLEAYGIGVPVGGSGSLTNALVASIESNGGEVVAEADVAHVEVSNGRAVGVTTTDGRTFAAREAVIGAIHPHDLGRMVAGLDPVVTRTAEATQISEIACITVHAALDEPLRFRAGDQVRAVMIELLPNDYNQVRKSFDKLRYGEFSDDVRPIACARRQSDDACLGLRAVHARRRPKLGRKQKGICRAHARPHATLHREPGQQRNRISLRQPGRYGAYLVDLPPRRSPRYRLDDLSVRIAPADARSRPERGAGLRAAIPRRAVSASRRRRLRRRPRGRCPDLR
jgi:phytoene dehydrogenase-like protein